MNRRSFLQQVGGLVVAGTLGWRACEAQPSGDALATLGTRLKGNVVRPTDASFVQARALFNPAVGTSSPLAVVYCETVQDVQRSITFAREHKIPCVPRGGGHSNAGYSISDGLVIDVSRLSKVSYRAGDPTARVAAGCQLLDLYDQLGTNGVTVPAGTCATVGIGGLTLGGGFGMLSRKLGLTCDNLLEVEIVTASGEVLTASETRHPDLFWACRGGGGGNFGIVTSFKFKVHPIDKVSFYEIVWPWHDASSVLDAWQKWAPHAPDELVSGFAVKGHGIRPGALQRFPVVTSQGAYLGPPEKLKSLIQPLLERRVGKPSTATVGTETYHDATRRWAGIRPGRPQALGANPQMTKSDFVDRLLPTDAIDRIIKHLHGRAESHTMTLPGHLALTAFGGAIQRISPDASAFPHRNALFIALYEAVWRPQDREQVATDNRNWIKDFRYDMRPYVSGSYVNFVDPDLEDWKTSYYGSNLKRLEAVKSHYDGGNFFHFPQSVPPGSKSSH